MKVRDSGMPPQDYWETLFDVPRVLEAFGFGPHRGDVAEVGCGYGTFTVPLAKRISGIVHALDIDPMMVAVTQERAADAGLTNVQTEMRDVLIEGFGRPVGTYDAVLLFNILHTEDPVALLHAARAVVRPGGQVAVIHWRSDIRTPRGPNLAIRPRPEQVRSWANEAGLRSENGDLALPPWHFGLSLRRPDDHGCQGRE